MKRGLVTALAIALLACTTAAPVPDNGGPPPAAFPSPLGLTIVNPDRTIVRGDTASIAVAVSPTIKNQPSATIGFGPLPFGLSGTSATWQGEQMVTLTLTASPDAPNVPMIVDVRAIQAEAIIGDAPLHVAVSAVEGSLDPTFGQDGVLSLVAAGSSLDLHQITARAGGGWRVSGTIQNSETQTLVVDLDASGAVQAQATHSVPGMNLFSSTIMATNVDGRMALGAIDQTPSTAVILLDPDGAPTGVLPGLSPGAFAWRGDQLLVGTMGDMVAVDSIQLTTTDLPIKDARALLATADGELYVASGFPSTFSRYVPGGASFVLDSSFGANGSAAIAPTSSLIGPMRVDETGRVLVGVSYGELGIVRLLTSGATDTTFGNAGFAGIEVASTSNDQVGSIVPLPSGDWLLVAWQSGSGMFATFTADGSSVADFGVLGRSTYAPAPESVAVDAAGHRACAVSQSTVYCLRLTQ